MTDVVQLAMQHAIAEKLATPATSWIVNLVTGEKLTGPIKLVSDGIYTIGSNQLRWFSSDKVAYLSVSSAGAFPI